MLNIGSFKGKAFVISLTHSTERRKSINEEFSRVNLDFEFIDAVDGRKLVLKNNPEINYEIIIKSSNWLTPNIIGASFSHLKCYKKIVDENLDFALIFEDDIKFNIKNVLNLTENIIKSTLPDSVALLYYQSFEKITIHHKNGRELGEKTFSYQVDDLYDLVSGAGYIIGRKSCEKMIKILLPIHIGPDCWQYCFQKGAFKNLYILYPMPCSTYNFRSTVTNLSIFEKGTLKSKIIHIIDKYKIPLFNQYLKFRRKKMKKSVQNINLIKIK